MSVLRLEDYRALAALDQPYERTIPAAKSEVARLLNDIAEHLHAACAQPRVGALAADWPEVDDVVGLRRLVRALLTVRSPEALPESVHAAIDSVLEAERAQRSEVKVTTLPRIADAIPESQYLAAKTTALWRGDITTLAADAIVNAANADLLGCFRPFHACIDNAIHSAAGPRVREDCGRIMALQGQREPTGEAKATRAYHLPARFVLHTVGPIVRHDLLPLHEAQLESSYRACLDLAVTLPGVRTVALCAISTGVFGFPKLPAARIATRTVAEWTAAHPNSLDLIVFNVFSAEDEVVYEDVLGQQS